MLRDSFGSGPDFQIWTERGPDDAPHAPALFPSWHLRADDVWFRDLQIAVGYVPLILLSGAAPAWWMLGVKRRKRRWRIARGRCAACSYDLRASAERCPECGTTIPEPAHSCGLDHPD